MDTGLAESIKDNRAGRLIYLKSAILTISILVLFLKTNGQQGDSVLMMTGDTLEVTISAFGLYRTENNVLPSIRILEGAMLDRNNKTSFVQSLNTLPGVRMEERSPGSYRINMRGSSLRSPFGVRNVKVYYNNIPLTDPGGNTYFNQLAFNSIASLEIAKGPGGSLYGAGTGGVILLNSLKPWQPGTEVELMAGGYGLLNISGSSNWEHSGKRQSLSISHTQQKGYREQSRMHRNQITYSGSLIKSSKNSLQVHSLFTDLYYQTPGGLTLKEYKENPKQARPAVGSSPSAQENKAAIRQQNLLLGLNNNWKINQNWKNETSLYGAFAAISNPSIRNYEKRSEPHTGIRSVFTYHPVSKKGDIQWLTGAESQFGSFNTRVFTNNAGEPGTLLTEDKSTLFSWNVFTQANLEVLNDIQISAGISAFNSQTTILRKNVLPENEQSTHFNTEWSPRISVQYNQTNHFQWSTVLSRGFSPPTIAELLPSTGVISTSLNAEYGWNWEAGMRFISTDKKFRTEVNYFLFILHDALVQRRDNTGGDYYVNAGETKQQGIEWSGQYLQLWQNAKRVQLLNIKAAYTFSHFRYTDFQRLSNNFSGNTLPSVPSNAFSLIVDVQWAKSFFITSSFYAASSIWLNDANTEKAAPYQLINVKVGFGRKIKFALGIENLLNQDYSLGNDINAFGGRYYNAAPKRNIFLSFTKNLNWCTKKQNL